MDLSKKAYANSLIVSARMQAFLNYYWGHVNATESKENAVFFQKMFLEFYHENVNKLLIELPDSAGLDIKEYLKSQLKDTDLQIDKLDDLTS